MSHIECTPSLPRRLACILPLSADGQEYPSYKKGELAPNSGEFPVTSYFDCPTFDPNGLVPLVKQMES